MINSFNQKLWSLRRSKWYHIVIVGLLLSLSIPYLFQLTRLLSSGKHNPVNNSLPLNLLWTYHSKNLIRVPPKGNNSLIVILRNDGVFIALDNETGNLRWEYDTQHSIGLPQSENVYDLDEDYLVTIVANEYLVVLNVQDGQEIWQTTLKSISNIIPEVLLLKDIVVVGTFSTSPTTEGYIVGYDLVEKGIIREVYLPSRAYDSVFKCPGIFDDFSESTVCISHFNGVKIVDFAPTRATKIVNKHDWDLFSYAPPRYQDGFVFMNRPPEPSIQVMDTHLDEQFDLPTSCVKEQTPHPVTIYAQMVLVSTGCGELYTLDIYSLQNTPMWTFQSPYDLQSSFVTVSGDIGYVLTERAEIIGINLENGKVVGSFTTKPTRLNKGILLHSLSENSDYLYAFLDGHQLFVFKE